MRRASFRGDFDEFESDEDRTTNPMRLIVPEFLIMKTQRDNQQTQHVGSTRGRQYVRCDTVSSNDTLINDDTSLWISSTSKMAIDGRIWLFGKKENFIENGPWKEEYGCWKKNIFLLKVGHGRTFLS